MTVTIKDVAKKANVSVSTVSLVLNDKKGISEKTRQEVLKAIKELNYHPHRGARGLASKKNGNIGFILTDNHFSRAEPFYTKIFLGSEFEARKHNYYILLTTVDHKFTKKSIPRFLLERNVDGVILAGKIPLGLVNYIRQYDLPMVFIDYIPPKGKYYAVLIDNIDGAIKAVTHLIEKGHERIGFIGGDISHPSIQERLEGYKRALLQKNITIDEKIIVTDEPLTSETDGYSAVCKLLKKDNSITAIFAANDAMAVGCMRCLHEHGIKVPEQIALVGFDDVDIAVQMNPRLTTIKVNKEEIGAVAISSMVEMISNERGIFGKLLVPIELIVRHSS